MGMPGTNLVHCNTDTHVHYAPIHANSSRSLPHHFGARRHLSWIMDAMSLVHIN